MTTVKKRSTTKPARTNKGTNGQRGPLESLRLQKHCQMCGAQDTATLSHRLEPAFDPSGQPKTLCRDCRIGSAELLADRRSSFDERELATVLAALWYWQRAIGVDSLPVSPLDKSAYMDHFNFSGDEEDQCYAFECGRN
jgi:hypothetical protein